jgi:hypothetical protein
MPSHQTKGATAMPETIKTRIHFYDLYVGSNYKGMQKSPDWPAMSQARQEWNDLHTELLATPSRGRCMHTLGDYTQHSDALDNVEIELELTHVFDNQWNTAPIPGVADTGLRVFDWADSADRTTHKSGHYLDVTPEMIAARNNTFRCGYCGFQTRDHDLVERQNHFCEQCRDSEHLKQTDLSLTRLLPVSAEQNRAPLTESETAWLVPDFIDAQIHGRTKRGIERIKKLRDSIEKDYQASTRNAQMKRDGLVWLLDRGLDINNVIYYNHTETFCIGWREALSDELMKEWCIALKFNASGQRTEQTFPFPIEFKTVSLGKVTR